MKKLHEDIPFGNFDIDSIQNNIMDELNVNKRMMTLLSLLNYKQMLYKNIYVVYENGTKTVIDNDNFNITMKRFDLFSVDTIYILLDISLKKQIDSLKDNYPNVHVVYLPENIKLTISEDIENIDELTDIISNLHSLNESHIYGGKRLFEGKRQKQYLNMDVELRKGGRNAVKMSVKDFENEMKAAHMQHIMDNDLYTRFRLNPDNFAYQCCDKQYNLKINPVIKMIQKDVWGEKYKFDGENCGCWGGIKMSKKGFPYIECYAGGDWECPVCFFVYFDGTRFRGYVPTKGNAFRKDNYTAFGND